MKGKKLTKIKLGEGRTITFKTVEVTADNIKELVAEYNKKEGLKKI
jgi:hypothetical protein